MKKVVAIIVKNLFSENVLKSVFVKVGDYLVSSSKNKLEDILKNNQPSERVRLAQIAQYVVT